MALATKPKPSVVKHKTGYEKWQDGIDKAVGNARWDVYDCKIQLTVNEFNRHLSGVAGYRPLDWQLIKAMLWTETGANNDFWDTNPMQIGMFNDPGLTAFLTGKEGVDLILPPQWRSTLTAGTARNVPSANIQAGIGYLLMKMTNFSIKSVPDDDTKKYEITVKAGDSLDKIAREHGSTVEMMRKLNPTAQILRPGQVLKLQKASLQKVIVGWKTITTASIAKYYNGGGNALYQDKLDYALSALRKNKLAVCAQ